MNRKHRYPKHRRRRQAKQPHHRINNHRINLNSNLKKETITIIMHQQPILKIIMIIQIYPIVNSNKMNQESNLQKKIR